MIGTRFGNLVVLVKLQSRDRIGNVFWACLCDCGQRTKATTVKLRSGARRSCGCLVGAPRHGHRRRDFTSRTYEAWRGMIRRCTKTNHRNFADYGGRGIAVCAEWLRSFDAFLRDMGECPEGRSLDRKNNGGNYEPSNCRWATRKEQGRNKRNNRMVEYGGEVMPLNAWAERLGMSRDVIRQRLGKLGWSVEKAFTTPIRPLNQASPPQG